jgi:hypothetical protein
MNGALGYSIPTSIHFAFLKLVSILICPVLDLRHIVCRFLALEWGSFCTTLSINDRIAPFMNPASEARWSIAKNGFK